jgi:hypothetical protein
MWRGRTSGNVARLQERNCLRGPVLAQWPSETARERTAHSASSGAGSGASSGTSSGARSGDRRDDSAEVSASGPGCIDGVTERAARTLLAGASGLACLTSLEVGNGCLGAVDANRLLGVLSALGSLSRLKLTIFKGATAALAAALAGAPQVEDLCLQSCVGCAAVAVAVEVARALRGLVRLRCVNLGGSCMGSVGFAALAPALPALTHLTRLELARSGLDAAAAVYALGSGESQVPSLVHLDLLANEGEVAASAELASALRVLSSLTCLRMDVAASSFSDADPDLQRRLRELTLL